MEVECGAGPPVTAPAPALPGSVVSLRGLVALSPGMTLKMAQHLRRNGRLRPDGFLLADDVLVARALAHSPGRSPSGELDARVERLLRRAVARDELAPSTVLLVAGEGSYEATLAVNTDSLDSLAAQGAAVLVLPVGRWWAALRVGLPEAAFRLPDFGGVAEVS